MLTAWASNIDLMVACGVCDAAINRVIIKSGPIKDALQELDWWGKKLHLRYRAQPSSSTPAPSTNPLNHTPVASRKSELKRYVLNLEPFTLHSTPYTLHQKARCCECAHGGAGTVCMARGTASTPYTCICIFALSFSLFQAANPCLSPRVHTHTHTHHGAA